LTDKDITASGAGHESWFTSSYSSASGSCVEVKIALDTVSVRDSKDARPGTPIISLSKSEWSSFMSAVRASPSSRDEPTGV
jgi:Domain of unknown function (DUF397)